MPFRRNTEEPAVDWEDVAEDVPREEKVSYRLYVTLLGGGQYQNKWTFTFERDTEQEALAAANEMAALLTEPTYEGGGPNLIEVEPGTWFNQAHVVSLYIQRKG